jgi:hypothetical protein
MLLHSNSCVPDLTCIYEIVWEMKSKYVDRQHKCLKNSSSSDGMYNTKCIICEVLGQSLLSLLKGIIGEKVKSLYIKCLNFKRILY